MSGQVQSQPQGWKNKIHNLLQIKKIVLWQSKKKKKKRTEPKYGRPSIQASSVSLDWTNHRSKKLFVLNLESFLKQNLNLLHAGNYSHSIYIVLGIINNLETI